MSGVTFKGLHSYNNFELRMVSDNREILSDVVRQTKFVSGLGTVDFQKDTYNEKPLVITFSYNFKNQPSLLQSQMEEVGGWLYNDGSYNDLIFDDAPNRKYRAKVVSKVNLSQKNSVATFQVEFICNPGYPFALDNSPVSPADVQKRLLWDTAKLDGIQYMQNFEADGTIDFTVGGTSSVKPIIKLIGTVKGGLTLTYSTQKWKYDSDILNDGIKIDCAAQTVTRLSDGANLFEYVNSTYYAFFTLLTGQQSISVSGVSGVFPNDLTALIEFTPQYGG